MNTETTINGADDEHESSAGNKSNLIKLEDAAEVEANGARDINNKITVLDADLTLLREELSAINRSVEEGLDRLGDTDTDLTAKVSETYKRLGEIDNAYKALLEISARIDGDIHRLNGDVSEVAEQSAAGIKHLEISNLEKSHELARKNEQVASRVNELVQTSRLTKELFDDKIKATADNISKMEQTLIERINTLAESTSDKNQQIEQHIEENHARIIKLQSVDEAIIRRATTLEITAAELTSSSQKLESAIDHLDASTSSLAAELKRVETRHEELAQVVASNSDMIGVLKSKSDELADNLAALAGLERRHFNRISMGFLALLVVMAIAYLSQQGQFAASDERFIAQTEKVENQIANLQQVQVSEKVVTESQIESLQSTVAGLAAEREVFQQELEQVRGDLGGVNDRVESVTARFDSSTSFSSFGNDNVIHGEYWISQQPAANYTIQVAIASDKSDLFAIALRENYRLVDSLSVVEVTDDIGTRFVLLSGNYASRDEAQRKLGELDGLVRNQRPAVIQLRDVQAYIAGKAAAQG